jgi:hypothetical protein
MSAGEGFLPNGNCLAVNASTSSVAVAMGPSISIVVTNRSISSPAFVTWNASSAPTAAFPTPGDTTGVLGMEVSPGAQVTIGVNGANAFVAVVLLSGTGVVTLVPGEGL